MKKSVILLVFFCILISSYVAAEMTIYDYLQRVDKQYYIVLGEKGKGGDSLAAMDVAIGIKRYSVSKLDIETVIEGEVNPSVNKILIGHPCSNSLIKLSCEDWPYKKGEAVVRVIGNDLVIAGTTIDDTRRAAKIISNYKKFSPFKESSSVIITGQGSPIKTRGAEVKKEKRASELICGDQICDPGENALCFIDCSNITCFDTCKQEGYAEAFCRDKKSNPSVPSCLTGEIDKGDGYCATGKVCCCSKKEVEEEKEEEKISQKNEEELSFFEAAWLWITNLFNWIF